VEKNLIYKNSSLDNDLKELNERFKNKKINLTGFYRNYSKFDMSNLLVWLDFASLLKNPDFLSKVNCETNKFISFKF
jgi:hypothetical protein